MADPIDDVKAKGKEFYEKAKSGDLDEATLKWGLSAGAVLAGLSLLFNYARIQIDLGFVRGDGGVSGLELLKWQGGSFEGLQAMAIPLTAIYSLYLQFGEPSLNVFKQNTPGRARLLYLIGMIASVLGVIGCSNFLRHQVCLGSTLGFLGLGLLAFVYFKLWRIAPDATAAVIAPTAGSTYCIKCGQPRQNDAPFCSSCGNKF